MSSRVFCFALFCLALLGLGTISRAGMTADTPYTNRGKTDFDTVLPLLNPYGSWSKIDGKWAFTPLDHLAPYTDGRWIYTEYGWYWKGVLPHSWVTEHYGYWKRDANKAVWSWYPGPYWLPQIVEIRATSKYLGWRSGEVDDDGNFVEAPIDRYSKTGEWTFVTLAQFANPITLEIVAPLSVTRTQLEESTECRHTYLTYREIDRPGPHPADLADLCKDGGMLPPKMSQDEMAAPAAPTNPAAQTAGVIPPALLGTLTDPVADTRRVKYWVTMSLPTYWSKPPPDAKPDQIYIYRPDFYQDQDGIERRITLWFNPNVRTNLKDILGKTMQDAQPQAGASPAIPASPALSTLPESAPADNLFRNPLGDSVPPASTNPSTNESTKNFAPSGLRAPDAPATNAAPTH